MKTLLLLVTFFIAFLGQEQNEVNEQIQYQGLPHRQGIFAGSPATYIYDGDITHIICFKDSICNEIGVFAPLEYYGNYHEYCDTTFTNIGDDHFLYKDYRIAFFKASDPSRFFLVGYEGGKYE